MTDIEQKPTISEETPIEKKTKQPKTGKTVTKKKKKSTKKVTTELPSFSEVSKKSKKKENLKVKLKLMDCMLMMIRLHREPEDVKLFVLEELMTTGSVDAKGGFTVRGKYYSSQLENIIYKYVKQYVICKVCDSLDTEFVKENRITFIYCNHCTSKMSVEMKKQT
ncbi:Translation initiation factor IF2/IF5 domain-containing protein [Entamoeba marina]